MEKAKWSSRGLRNIEHYEANWCVHLDEGFLTQMLMCFIVAVGAEEPLAEHMMVADFFRTFMYQDYNLSETILTCQMVSMGLEVFMKV